MFWDVSFLFVEGDMDDSPTGRITSWRKIPPLACYVRLGSQQKTGRVRFSSRQKPCFYNIRRWGPVSAPTAWYLGLGAQQFRIMSQHHAPTRHTSTPASWFFGYLSST